MPMLNGLPSAAKLSTTGRKYSALIGWTGLPPAIGSEPLIMFQTRFDSVMALPFRSRLSGAIRLACVP